ncbi:VanZ family protein [Paenibacillus sp. UNC451MF]|uniref:VanZ family protein n=1 Tax=Paenibacillus sp. UNC451MF TaxID=1449063 RepID=UPI000690C350|nr:VanZ family protein [Paenibacillus sp. UNC451MF]
MILLIGVIHIRAAKRWKFIVWLILSCFWIVLIFVKSAQTYAEQDIRPLLAEWLPLDLLNRWLPHIEFYYDGGLVTWTKPYDFIEFIIRKGGHVTEFAVLCFLSIMTLLSKPIKTIPSIAMGSVFSVLYAASDEWHQSFVPGRTGHAIDVMVDSIGVVLAALVIGAVKLAFRKRKAN